MTVHGEVDVATAGALRETLKRATVPGTKLVVDLAGGRGSRAPAAWKCSYAARSQLEKIGSTMVLRSPHERVMRILEVSGLDRIIRSELGPWQNDKDHDLGGLDGRKGQLPG